ncbi:folliculogenesis specific basic helix-loop-helix [Cricetulus griseus]
MDTTSPASPEPFLAVPQAEVLQELLQAQLGPLPRLAAICRLKRLPSGSYSTMDDLHLVLERRRVANAKERERVRVQGHLTPQPPCQWVFNTQHLCAPSWPSWVTSSPRVSVTVPVAWLHCAFLQPCR